MIESDEIKKIKEVVEEFFEKMTITDFNIELESYSTKKEHYNLAASPQGKDIIDIVDLDIKIKEPQILIGQSGQTLFELQRILRIILNKKLQKNFYLKLDINDYKKKKIEYLKKLAKDLADEVFLTKEKKILSPMPAYERRVIHTELADRQDIITESQGDGANRCVVIRHR